MREEARDTGRLQVTLDQVIASISDDLAGSWDSGPSDCRLLGVHQPNPCVRGGSAFPREGVMMHNKFLSLAIVLLMLGALTPELTAQC